MVGDALVLEHERLNQRMNSFFDKVELHLKDILYPHASASGHPTPTLQAQLQAQLLTALVLGQMQRFVRSHFRRKPTERLTEALAQVLH
jgi:TetR/AcrR family transcriptional regulator